MPSQTDRSAFTHHSWSQRRLRQRLGGRPIRQGVRLSVRALFGFTHRADVGEALWSGRESVWLGRATFLHWAMNDATIDIPWMVMKTDGAPECREELRAAVRGELILLWAERLAFLPCKNTPAWLPLP